MEILVLELFDLSWCFSGACRNGCTICVFGFVLQGYLKFVLIIYLVLFLREMAPPRRNTGIVNRMLRQPLIFKLLLKPLVA